MSESNESPDRIWESGWDEHERLQQERLANLPLSEKLKWLEEAHRLVLQIREAQSKQKPKSDSET